MGCLHDKTTSIVNPETGGSQKVCLFCHMTLKPTIIEAVVSEVKKAIRKKKKKD